MTAMIVRPLGFTVSSNTGWVAANPVTNLNLDHSGLVARSTGTTASFTVSLGSATSIDTVALIGSNLPSTATVTVTATGYASGATAAYTGVKDAETTTKTIFQFSPITTTTVTVSITVPSGTIEAQRLVIGKRVEIDGLDGTPEQTFDDQSVIDTGPGYTSVEEFNVLMSWKAKASWITDASWRSDWFPLLSRVGLKKPVLFVPVSEDPTRFQHEAVFGRFNSIAKGEYAANRWIVSFGITALAP